MPIVLFCLPLRHGISIYVIMFVSFCLITSVCYSHLFVSLLLLVYCRSLNSVRDDRYICDQIKHVCWRLAHKDIVWLYQVCIQGNLQMPPCLFLCLQQAFRFLVYDYSSSITSPPPSPPLPLNCLSYLPYFLVIFISQTKRTTTHTNTYQKVFQRACFVEVRQTDWVSFRHLLLLGKDTWNSLSAMDRLNIWAPNT